MVDSFQYGTVSARVRCFLSRLRRLLPCWRSFPSSFSHGCPPAYGRIESATWGANCYGHQKSAKPKAKPPGDHDFKAVQTHGARNGIPRRSGNLYADDLGSAYTYTPGGKLATRLWARGITTAYAYAPISGELISIDYSDATPDIAYAHDRSGNMASVTDASGTRTFSYTPDGQTLTDAIQLQNEAFTLHEAYDAFGRNAGYALSNTVSGVASLIMDTALGYDPFGRLSVCSVGNFPAPFRYGAFGNTLEQSGPLADTFRFRFSTKYFIPETKSYYYGHRFYSVVLGRWLNRDAFGEQGGLNLYLFTLNEPLNAIDWLGNCTLEIHIGENKPGDAPSDAGGWFEGVLPSFWSKNKECPAGQVGTKFTVGECSAKVWLKSDTPYHRNHELSHVKCLDTLESQLSSIAIELGCVCQSPCYDAHVAWIAAIANHASTVFAACIASRDCHDNGNGQASSRWCVDFATKEQAQKAALKAVQEASRRMSDACKNN